MELDPIAVGLKFGFLAVLYLFLLWVARSALKDLRRGTEPWPTAVRARTTEDATGMYSASAPIGRDGGPTEAARRTRRRVWRPAPPMISATGALLGRGDQADIRLEDGFASSQHARLIPQGDVMVLEDLGLHERHVPER